MLKESSTKLILSFFVFAACATSEKKIGNLKELFPSIATKTAIEGVPFILQEEAFCGPASLAMLLNYRGEQFGQHDLSEFTFIAKAKGSFQENMRSATRKKGYLFIEVKGIENLLREIDANNPVIVLRNLGFDWYPLWHYSVVFGYDLVKKELKMHSGEYENKTIKITTFMKSWNRAEKWGFTAIEPGHSSATGSELEHMKSSSALEKLGYYELAQKAYLELHNRNPASYMALVGLGNIALRNQKLEKALSYYLRAKEIAPDNQAILHNLNYIQNLISNKK